MNFDPKVDCDGPILISKPGDAEENHKEFYNGEELEHHEAKFSHELIAGAASYEAMKAYNKHREENGMCQTMQQ